MTRPDDGARRPAGDAPDRPGPLRRAGHRAADVRRRVAQGVAWARDYAWITRAQAAAWLRPPPGDALRGGSRAPVVLLPGIYETWPVMSGLARALHAAGHPVHAVPALGLNHGTLADAARLAVARVVELDLCGAVLVAHSKGGLVGKLVLGDPDAGLRSGRVTGLVAVNTPFAGSVLARWFPVRSVRALAPGDPYLRALAHEVATHARIWSLHARFDPHVPGVSELPGAANVTLPLDGHFRLLGDPLLHAEVVAAVAELEATGQEPAGS